MLLGALILTIMEVFSGTKWVWWFEIILCWLYYLMVMNPTLKYLQNKQKGTPQ
jgi:hypothetical protein